MEQIYDVKSKLLALIESITHETWNDYKNRFIFAKKCADKLDKQPQENIPKGSILAHKIFHDDEKDFGALVKKYTAEKNWYSSVSAFFKNNTANEISAEAKKILDSAFVQQVSGCSDESIVAKFSEVYQVWKKSKFQESMKEFLQNFKLEAEKTLNKINERELLNRKQKLERRHFDEICDKLESKYPRGDLFEIINVVGKYDSDKFYKYGKYNSNNTICLND